MALVTFGHTELKWSLHFLARQELQLRSPCVRAGFAYQREYIRHSLLTEAKS